CQYQRGEFVAHREAGKTQLDVLARAVQGERRCACIVAIGVQGDLTGAADDVIEQCQHFLRFRAVIKGRDDLDWASDPLQILPTRSRDGARVASPSFHLAGHTSPGVDHERATVSQTCFFDQNVEVAGDGQGWVADHGVLDFADRWRGVVPGSVSKVGVGRNGVDFHAQFLERVVVVSQVFQFGWADEGAFMARSGVSKAEVQSARLALIARGENPSIDAVRIEMGNTGSKTTIHRFMRELDAIDVGASPTQIDDELMSLVNRLAGRL
nr:hypothetical protein [Tanacetum cinerariifolium]